MFFWHCTISWPQVPPACLPPVPGRFEQHPERMTQFHFKIHHTRQSSRPVILFRIFLVIPGPSHQVHAVVHLCFTTGMTRHSVCGHGGSPTGLCPASTAARSGYPMNSILFTVSGVCSSHGPGTQATPAEMLDSPAHKQSVTAATKAPSLPSTRPTFWQCARIF